MNKKVGSIKWNRGISVFLTILLIALPALAQSTQEQEQPAQVASDEEQKEPEDTLNDQEQGRINGEIAGYAAMKNNFWWYSAGAVAASGLPLIGFIVFKDSQYPVEMNCDEIVSSSSFSERYLTGTLIGIFLASTGGLLKPSNKPSLSAFIGKSPEYIDSYQEAFRAECKKEQIIQYYTGYFFGVVLFLCVYVYIVGIDFSLD